MPTSGAGVCHGTLSPISGTCFGGSQPACPPLGPQTPAHLTSGIHEGSVLLSASPQSWKVPTAMISYLSGWHTFPWNPSAVLHGALQAFIMALTPVLSQWPNLQSPSLNTQPPLTTAGTQTNVSDWEVLSALRSVVNSFHFFFQGPVCGLPSEVLKLTPIPSH